MPLRPCSTALATALSNGTPLWEADIFKISLSDGVTTILSTSWDSDLLVGSTTYLSKNPWVNRSKWTVANTMEVPTMTLSVFANNSAYNGGANIKAQMHNGLFDGAFVLFSIAYMTSPSITSALGQIDIWGGMTGAVDITGTGGVITCEGKNTLLDQNAPRNVYQVGCNHAFCDVGCTLSRSAYTSTGVVGSASPTVTFIPWSGTPPTNPQIYVNGTIAMLSGVSSGQRRTVQAASSAGLTVSYPFYAAPAPVDSYSLFQGCDKTSNSGSGQSCSDRSNLQHFRGYPFVPPPEAAW